MKELIDKLWSYETLNIKLKIVKHILKKVKGYHIVGNIDNQHNWPYSFVRLYGNYGYIGTIPFYYGQLEREDHIHYVVATDFLKKKSEYKLEVLKNYITRVPRDERYSNNGGDYYEGYQLCSMPDGSYSVIYNSALYSDFSSQCKTEEGIFSTLQEAVKYISENGNIIQVD